mgnify:CR=1 FL=1
MTPDILTTIFSPFNLLMMNIGMAAGIIIGALPGLSAVIAITILLPVTFGLESIPGMYILLGMDSSPKVTGRSMVMVPSPQYL